MKSGTFIQINEIMKKYIIIPALAAMTLMSCGGGTTTQNNGADTTAANAAATLTLTVSINFCQ